MTKRNWNQTDREAQAEAEAINRLPKPKQPNTNCRSKRFDERLPAKGRRKIGLTKADLSNKPRAPKVSDLPVIEIFKYMQVGE